MTEDTVQKSDGGVMESTHAEIPREMSYLLVGAARWLEANANLEAADVLVFTTLWS